MKRLKIFGKTLAFVTAHPDDESFWAAGTMQRNHQQDGQSFIICATWGERGKAHVSRHVTKDQLKRMRASELKKVCQCLDVQELINLELPDGKVESHKTILAKQLENHLKNIDPDYIVSFGPDGMTGHKDHIAVGQVAKRIAKTLKTPFIAFAPPPSLTRKFLLQRRKHGQYSRRLVLPQATHVTAIDKNIKLTALAIYASQLNAANPVINFPPRLREDFLNREYFILK